MRLPVKTALLLLAAAALSAPARAAMVLEFSQDGVHYSPLSAVNRTLKPGSYFDSFTSPDNPRLTTGPGVSSIAFYYDRVDNRLGLMLVSNTSRKTGGVADGSADFTISNLPSSAKLVRATGADEVTFKKVAHSIVANFDYTNEFDGLMIGNLQAATSFNIQINLTDSVDLQRLQIADPGSGKFFKRLNASEPVYIRGTYAVTAPHGGGTVGIGVTGGGGGGSGGGITSTLVPEPSSAALVALAGLCLAKRTRRAYPAAR